MLGEPALGSLELFRRIGSFDEAEQFYERTAPFLFQCCGQFLLGQLMLAVPDQRRKIGIEQLGTGTQVPRQVLPGCLYRVAILRLVEMLTVNADGPCPDRVLGDTPLCLQARQQLIQVVPVFEAVVELAEQAERVAVIARVLFDSSQRRKCLLILIAVELQFGLRQERRRT